MAAGRRILIRYVSVGGQSAKTPSERIKAHQRALNTALMLRKAMKKKYAEHAEDKCTHKS